MIKLAVASLSLVMAVSAQAGLYRWVDDAGNVHFSDKVPAVTSIKSHAKLNKSGDVTHKVDPESEQKKRELKAAKQLEKEQLAELQAIKAEAEALIQQKNNNLLSTYEDEEELISFFESKIKMAKGNSQILEAQKTVLKNKVTKLEHRSVNIKAETTMKKITSNIVKLNDTLAQYDKALLENEKQMLKLSTNYQNDLARYKELTEK